MKFKTRPKVDLDKLFDAKISNKISDQLFENWYKRIKVKISDDLHEFDSYLPLSTKEKRVVRVDILDLIEPVCRRFFYSNDAKNKRAKLEQFAVSLTDLSLYLMEDTTLGIVKKLSRLLTSVTNLHRKLNSNVVKQTRRHIKPILDFSSTDIPSIISHTKQQLGDAYERNENERLKKIVANFTIQLKYTIWYHQDMPLRLQQSFNFLTKEFNNDIVKSIVDILLDKMKKEKFPIAANADSWFNRAKSNKYKPRKNKKPSFILEVQS